MTIILYGIINDISNTRLDIFFQSSKSKHMYDLITGKAYTTYFKPKGPFSVKYIVFQMTYILLPIEAYYS
jgi:hypothetical protein